MDSFTWIQFWKILGGLILIVIAYLLRGFSETYFIERSYWKLQAIITLKRLARLGMWICLFLGGLLLITSRIDRGKRENEMRAEREALLPENIVEKEYCTLDDLDDKIYDKVRELFRKRYEKDGSMILYEDVDWSNIEFTNVLCIRPYEKNKEGQAEYVFFFRPENNTERFSFIKWKCPKLMQNGDFKVSSSDGTLYFLGPMPEWNLGHKYWTYDNCALAKSHNCWVEYTSDEFDLSEYGYDEETAKKYNKTDN